MNIFHCFSTSSVMLNFGELCQHPPIPPLSITMVMAPCALVTKHVIHSQALAVARFPVFGELSHEMGAQTGTRQSKQFNHHDY